MSAGHDHSLRRPASTASSPLASCSISRSPSRVLTAEALFGIDDLFKSVADRLEALRFEITTVSQQSVSRLGFWLITSFGAIETGFVAASIATWLLRHRPCHDVGMDHWCHAGHGACHLELAALEIEAVTPRSAAR